MKKDAGFTILEVMIVISIISILAAASTLGIMKAVHSSRVKTAETELALLSTGISQLAWDTGLWPNGEIRTQTEGSIVDDLSGQGAGLMTENTNNVFGDNWKGPYYEGNVRDPWGDQYYFTPNYKNKGFAAVASRNDDVPPASLD